MVEDEDLNCEEQRKHLALKKEVELSMVFIRESTDFANNDRAVFPPINHENIYIDGFDRDRKSSSPSSSSRLSDSSLSPSDSDGQFEFDRKPQCRPLKTDGKSPPSNSERKCERKSLNYYSTLKISIIQGWSKLLLARVLSKLQKLVTCFSSSSLRSFSRTLYPIMVIVIWWWMRNRARRRLLRRETEAHLRDTINERDEVCIYS